MVSSNIGFGFFFLGFCCWLRLLGDYFHYFEWDINGLLLWFVCCFCDWMKFTNYFLWLSSSWTWIHCLYFWFVSKIMHILVCDWDLDLQTSLKVVYSLFCDCDLSVKAIRWYIKLGLLAFLSNLLFGFSSAYFNYIQCSIKLHKIQILGTSFYLSCLFACSEYMVQFVWLGWVDECMKKRPAGVRWITLMSALWFSLRYKPIGTILLVHT